MRELSDQLVRLVDRLRGMALTRLQAAYHPEPTRVAAGRAFAQRLADAAAAVEAPGAPVHREVPEVSAAAVGDLVAVCGHDLLLAAYGDSADLSGARLAELAESARELRLRL